MLSTVIGGAMPPHAPQLFATPDTEGFTFDGEICAHPLVPFLARLQIERLAEIGKTGSQGRSLMARRRSRCR